MFSKESLFINAVRYDNQLKLDYKKLNQTQIINTNNSSFITTEDILPTNIALKINSSQEEVDNTYISTLLLSDTTKLVKKIEAQKLIDECDISSFDEEYDIVALKTTLFETKNYFEKTGIDFIFSAFHILSLHLEQNVLKNQLLVLLHNNKAFIIIVNDNSNVVFNDVLDLPSFEEIKTTHFFEDDLERQKLYDEIYSLKVYESISKSINSFYSTSTNTFIEKITILYTLKHLTNEDIDNLSEELLLDVDYHPINIDEEVFELIKNKHINKSFISPRKKKKSKDISSNILFLLIFGILIFGFYYVYETFNNVKQEKIEVSIEEKKQILLPNHIHNNNKVYINLQNIVNNVPYDMVLDEIVLDEKDVLLKGILLKSDSFIKSVKPAYEKYYDDININFLEKDKNTLTKVEVELQNKNEDKDLIEPIKVKYIIDDFIPVVSVTEQLNTLLGENTNIKFISSKNREINTFIYDVNMNIETPKEFFNKIQEIKNELYSINIEYPIVLKKDNGKLKVNFKLHYNQLKR